MKRILLILVAIGAILFVLIQFIPVDRTNPPVVREISWDSPETKALAQRACYDCHSNTTKYPWYSRIAPPSLLMARHIEEGRENMNFSDWDNYYVEAGEIEEQVREGEMPPRSYLLAHPEARLTGAEKEQFLAGAAATIASDPGQ